MVIMKIKKLAKDIGDFKELHDSSEKWNKSDRDDVPKEIRIIAQEVKIVRSLVCNDINKRNRQLIKLRKWLQLRARSSFPFTEEDLLRIWKGLYYNMWMSDKPLVQEKLAEQLAQLLECFDGDAVTSVNFFSAFMKTMCNEWFGIDQWRIDKFMMLVRRMLRSLFRVLKQGNWNKDSIKLLNEHMELTVLAEESPAIGLTMHYLDIFFEELAKVSGGEISAEQVGDFVRPFVTYLVKQRDFKLVSHCSKQVLYHLLYQSALGREYSEKYNAWRQMGFPTKSIHDLEKIESAPAEVEAEDHEAVVQQEEVHLDPRAGNVDVYMPELPLDAKYVIDELDKFIYKDQNINTKRRKSLRKHLTIFQIYQRGEFPLGIKTIPRFKDNSKERLIKDKIEQLENVENELFGAGRMLKQLNKRKRRKLLKSLNFAEVDEANFDEIIMKVLPKEYVKGRKRKAGSIMNDWVEEEIGEEDLSPNKIAKHNKYVGKPPRKHKGTKQDIEYVNNQTQSKPSESDEKPASLGKFNEVMEGEKKNVNCTKDISKGPTQLHHGITTEENVEAGSNLNSQSTTAKRSNDEWDSPLAEGEIEYFIPSRKIQVKNANTDFVRNPLAQETVIKNLTPVSVKKHCIAAITPKTPGSVKHVKIALKHNTSQNPSEYIRQIKTSPNLPFDACKKPGKGLLKPNSIPSPINPFYKKKIGLRLPNDII